LENLSQRVIVRAVSSWASFAESDRPGERQPEPEEPETETQPEGKVEDLAVGRLRLWLRGFLGGASPRE
jgi:hypothetical protein